MGITTQATYFQISGPVSPFLRKTPDKFVNLYGSPPSRQDSETGLPGAAHPVLMAIVYHIFGQKYTMKFYVFF